MIASLMMYARPELAPAHDRLWSLIKAELMKRGIDAPDALSQNTNEFAVWTDPDLVLSQTCGMPYRLWLHDRVTLVGTPDYGLEGCPPGHYRSAIVVRADDARTDLAQFSEDVFAYNQVYSQSGFAAPYRHLTAKGIWFEHLLHTGAHITSAKAVADGRAGLAALDAVSWRLMQRYDGFASQLRVLDWTEPTPGLPLISRSGADAAAIYDAFSAALDELSA